MNESLNKEAGSLPKTDGGDQCDIAHPRVPATKKYLIAVGGKHQ